MHVEGYENWQGFGLVLTAFLLTNRRFEYKKADSNNNVAENKNQPFHIMGSAILYKSNISRRLGTT